MTQALPHRYRVQADGGADGVVRVASAGLPELATQAPPEFGGPEGFWSPETLLAAAVADCYILSFRAVARASGLQWRSLQVGTDALLERVEGTTRFTRFTLAPRLVLRAGASETLAQTVLKKAKAICLVTNSLNGECELAPEVHVEADEAA